MMKPPIADPFGPPATNESADETQLFSFDLWRVFKASFLPLLVFTLVVGMIIDSTRGYVEFVLTLASSLVFLASALIPSALMQIRVTKTGLKAPNLWCLPREVRWEDIAKARYFWLGWPYLSISMPQKRNVIWIPLFLSDPEGFACAVEEWAPEGNPLRLWIQKRGF